MSNYPEELADELWERVYKVVYPQSEISMDLIDKISMDLVDIVPDAIPHRPEKTLHEPDEGDKSELEKMVILKVKELDEELDLSSKYPFSEIENMDEFAECFAENVQSELEKVGMVPKKVIWISPMESILTARSTFEYLMRQQKDSGGCSRLDKISSDLGLRKTTVFSALNRFIDHEFVEYEWEVDRVETPDGPRPKGLKCYRLKDDWLEILEMAESTGAFDSEDKFYTMDR
jgi:hypothetical protein